MVASGRVQASVGRGDLHEDEQFAAAHKPACEEWPRKCWADRWGGFFKRVLAKGGAVMRAEVDRVMPLVEQGGYPPEIDHSVPPDVSWANFCDYIGYLKHRLGRG